MIKIYYVKCVLCNYEKVWEIQGKILDFPTKDEIINHLKEYHNVKLVKLDKLVYIIKKWD